MIPEVELNYGSDFCVVTAYDENLRELGDIASNISIRYCRKHRYDLRVYTSGQDKTKHPAWSKILFVKECLKSHKWVFWIDADAIFTNFKTRLESLTEMNGVLTIATEGPFVDLNSGVFLLRQCDVSFKLLEDVWNDYSPDYITWEQVSINKFAKKLGAHVVTYNNRRFNSFFITRTYPEYMRWVKGDFIAHILGGEQKLERMKDAIMLSGINNDPEEGHDL